MALVEAKAPYHRAIVGDGKIRARDDFYPTPPEATRALLSVEDFSGGLVWEPACGNGAISRLLEDAGYPVLSSDLVDRGFGEAGVDFLLDHVTRARHIVTNPPYVQAQEFVEHGLTRVDGKVVMLLKLVFLEGERRRSFYQRTPLKRVWVFSRRLKMSRDGTDYKARGMIAFAWFVWEQGFEGEPSIGWL